MVRECASCSTLYAPDLPMCPHCGTENPGDDMPKTTVHGGSSQAGVDSPAPGLTAQETSDDPAYEYTLPAQPEGTDTPDEAAPSTDGGSEPADDTEDGGSAGYVPPSERTASRDAVAPGEPVTLERADTTSTSGS